MTETSPSVALDDVLVHVDRALSGMRTTLESLGDDLANRRPDLEGANSAYVIVTHCLGVMEFWAGQVIAARAIDRDRAAEFVATGTVDDLVTRMSLQRKHFEQDLEAFDGAAPPPGPLDDRDREDMPQFTRTQGGVLMHIYEELAQHRGHLDVTADLVRKEHR
ncbi:DUF664 domain-containing protein [Luteipulveratus mongoliensis]|uniref:DUF664 domain-containing protein n=1 Tax=Luteipulveratus mongoliensis TaxID=571913 RepID=A0A0K1JL51_9MICO|nr:DUF664 domain-containing protein [Luteipulveratus mongoliensis]AKU17454.1 hypothetical protein VV02_19055 [Luteipulveratus mongoliensis]